MKKGYGQVVSDTKELSDPDGTHVLDVDTMFINPGYDLQSFAVYMVIIAESGAIFTANLLFADTLTSQYGTRK